MQLMKVAMSDLQFSFNNIIYSQIDDVAKGSPSGQKLANIFVIQLESKITDDLSSQVIYIRYVEDCLVISKTESDNKATFQKLNSFHEKISFTR